MKILVKTILVALVLIMPFISKGEDNNETYPIKLSPTGDNGTNRPRTPDFGVPIEAYYQGGVIYLHFSEDIGCMDVNVTNITTGEQWNDSACADNSVEVIAVSESHGNYQITLESETGTTYFGEFSL